MQETEEMHVWPMGQEAPLEDGRSTHSNILAQRIPWTEESGRLQSMGSLSWTWLSYFTFTFHFHALEKEIATHSSVLAWRVPGTAEPGGLPSMGSHRVGHDWSDLAAAAAVLTIEISKVVELTLKPRMTIYIVNLLGSENTWSLESWFQEFDISERYRLRY